MSDLKFAFRQVLKYPGFTAVAVLTLAIGIGATTSISCWLNASIIGVIPAGFRFPYRTEVWTPLSFGAQELDQRDHRLLKVVGRLKANVALAAAQAELTAITTRIAMRFPATNRGWGSTLESPGFDRRVLCFALGLCFVTGLAFGTIPAWVLTKPSPGVILKQAAGVFGASAGSRLWFNYWIICEVGCAVSLLMGAGLMILALDRLTRVDLGFDPNHLLIAEVNPEWDAQEPDYSPKKVLCFERFRDELSRSAGISDAAIFRDDGWLDCLAEGEPDRMQVYGWSCSSNIFRTLRVPLMRGRLFPENWKKGEPIEVVVNETLRFGRGIAVRMTFMSSRLNQPYVHGSKPQEQRRLPNLNKLLNQACLRELALKRGEVILDVGSGFDPHLARFDRTPDI